MSASTTATRAFDAPRAGVLADRFDRGLADVATALAAGTRPIGPAEFTRARARRRFLRIVAGRVARGHHDLPAA